MPRPSATTKADRGDGVGVAADRESAAVPESVSMVLDRGATAGLVWSSVVASGGGSRGGTPR